MQRQEQWYNVAPSKTVALPNDPEELMWGSLIYAAVAFCVAFFLRFGF